MKRLVTFVVAMLLPVGAAAQTGRQTPPAPPAPPAPQTPVTPPVPPTPPSAPVVVYAPSLDLIDVDGMVRSARLVRLDSEQAREIAAQAREAAAQAVAHVDVDAIREQARAAVETARAAAEQSREFRLVRPDMGDFHYEMPNFDFNFDFQEKFQVMGRMDQSSDSSLYNTGLSAIQSGQFDRALTMFDRVIAQKGTRADAALYWKGYTLFKLARTEDTIAAIAQLRREYPQSAYLNDARVLEADARKVAGQPMDPNAAANDEIKLLAISGLMNAEPERAIPLAENLLATTNSLQVKKRAIYVLATSDDPRAHQILLRYAKGAGNPDLQAEAIRYLATRRDKKTTDAELKEIYESSKDNGVKSQIISAYGSSRNKEALVTIAGDPTAPIVLRQSAVRNLNDLASPQDLWSLYQKETEKDLRLQMLSVFSSMGAVDQLQQAIKIEKDPEVRRSAIRRLGGQKSERTGPMLVDLYGTETDKDNRKAVISALANQNNAEGLVAVAKKETSLDLKRDIVAKLSDMAPKSKAAADYLMEIIK